MATSDLIAGFIQELLDSSSGIAELRRGSLAEKFSCAPSQINYVISTRFSPEHGYIVESRRGGGGYIRISRVRNTPRQLIMHTVNSVGESLSPRTAAAFISNLLYEGALSSEGAGIMAAALSDNALRSIAPEHRDLIRAAIFKQMLVSVLSENK
jgi:transcriptional regulator CtsR